MAITSLDIKFRQSERMTDFSDGGGRMSAVEIVDGDMNNVFPDRSDLGAILGNVSLRKMFLHVDTTNTDTYLGAFVFLTDPPAEPLVDVTLFNTASATDERTAAQNYVEAYRTKGTKTQFVLYGTHLAGQMTLQVYCRPEISSPDIGDVLCLSVEASGYPVQEQYVRVQSVASRITTTFEDTNGQFDRDVLIIQITQALAYEFIGQEDPQRFTGALPPPTKIRRTSVANAARYYAVKPTTDAALLGALSVNIGNPYVTIVPSSQAETPIVDQLAGLGSLALIQSSASAALTFSGSMTGTANELRTRYFGTPYARRSLVINFGSVELRDNGAGDIVATDPLNTGWTGVADYATGAFAIAKDIGFSGTVSATATAAGAITEQAFSIPIVVTAATRQQTYVYQLPAQPSPGTVIIDFRALGKWIRLYDNGAGQLSGNVGEGSGTINYATGSVAVTLGALPDIDSAVILAWGTDLRAHDSHGEITIPAPTFRQQLDHTGIVPDTLEMTWLSSTVAKSATTDAAGVISGDATGLIDHIAGVATFTTAATPDGLITYAYDYVDPADVRSEVFTPTPVAGLVSVTVAGAPMAANTVRADWFLSVNFPPRVFQQPSAVDDGAGNWAAGVVGSINYTTGAISLEVE
jgi:hypothetical protein